MKRLSFAILMALCGSFTANAAVLDDGDDETTAKDRLEQIEGLADKVKEKKAEKATKPFDFSLLEQFGWGFVLPGGTDAFSVDRNDSRELWFNACRAKINVVSWFGIDLGLNLLWKRFRANGDNYVYIDNANDFKIAPIATQQALYPAAGGTFKTLTSQINTFSIETPLMLDFHSNSFAFRLGALAGFNASACQKERVAYGTTQARSKVKGGDVAGFYFGPCLELVWGGLGVYMKYIPVEIVPGIITDYISAGLVLDI